MVDLTLGWFIINAPEDKVRQGDAAVETSCSFRQNVFFKKASLQNIHRCEDCT